MEPATMNGDVPVWFASYAHVRTDSYVMLASLLSRAPSGRLLELLHNLTWERTIPKNLDGALEALKLAGQDCDPAAAAEEFARLFVGLGSGELVPYASWYREKKIQSSPLAALRTDLMKFGIVRQVDSRESEDHAGVLCEIMALMTRKQCALPRQTQAEFFHRHLAPWMIHFFRDLQSIEFLQEKEDQTMKKEVSGNRRQFLKRAAFFSGIATLLTLGKPAVFASPKPAPPPRHPAGDIA